MHAVTKQIGDMWFLCNGTHETACGTRYSSQTVLAFWINAKWIGMLIIHNGGEKESAHLRTINI